MTKSQPKVPYGSHWRVYFKQKISIVNGHWIWKGNVDSRGVARFSHYSFKGRNLSAIHVARMYKDKKDSLPVAVGKPVRFCSHTKCINPDHFTDAYNEVGEDRNKQIVGLYKNHMMYKDFNMAEIGRKFGITRERVRVIIRDSK